MIINFGGGSSGGTPGSGDKNYVHNQSVPSADWEIHHNLGKFPAVSVIDSSGALVHGDCQYVDANNIILHFHGAFSGKAYLN